MEPLKTGRIVVDFCRLATVFVGLDGDSRFVGSNPAEVDGFFQDVKILSTSFPEGL